MKQKSALDDTIEMTSTAVPNFCMISRISIARPLRASVSPMNTRSLKSVFDGSRSCSSIGRKSAARMSTCGGMRCPTTMFCAQGWFS